MGIEPDVGGLESKGYIVPHGSSCLCLTALGMILKKCHVPTQNCRLTQYKKLRTLQPFEQEDNSFVTLLLKEKKMSLGSHAERAFFGRVSKKLHQNRSFARTPFYQLKDIYAYADNFFFFNF